MVWHKRLWERVGVHGAVVAPLSVAYSAGLWTADMLRFEHVAVIGAWVVLTYVPRASALVRQLLPFFLFGLVYDALRFVLPWVHRAVPIRVAEPYQIELALFGIEQAGRTLTPPELLQQFHSPVLLLLSGFAYFFFIYQVLLVGLWMLARERALLPRFAWAFFALSLLGIITWCVYPAAPPWYVAKYGLGPADIHAPADAARLLVVDEMLGIDLFAGFYARASNVFGAIPSLHAAYPMLVWLYVRRSRLARLHWAFFAFWLLMCFAAVYLHHHYVIDVLLGSLYAGATVWLVERMAPRVRALGQPGFVTGGRHG